MIAKICGKSVACKATLANALVAMMQIEEAKACGHDKEEYIEKIRR